jgi:hypothetical protein
MQGYQMPLAIALAVGIAATAYAQETPQVLKLPDQIEWKAPPMVGGASTATRLAGRPDGVWAVRFHDAAGVAVDNSGMDQTLCRCHLVWPAMPHLPGAGPWAFGFGSGALGLAAATLPSVRLQGSTSNDQILLCCAPANRHCRRYARCQPRSSTSGGTAATTATN